MLRPQPSTGCRIPLYHTERPFIARMIHALAVPIILFWFAVVGHPQRVRALAGNRRPGAVGVAEPERRTVVGGPEPDRPRLQRRQYRRVAMIVLESDKLLGDDATGTTTA